jgi:flavin reductase (DIM6/NTAB) family NADH-FMN oxidoreductase RutF
MLSDEEETCCYVFQKQLLSRFLYANPVCLLSLTGCYADSTNIATHSDSDTVYTHDKTRFRNVMTISWLMPVDNQANILLSINANRFTAQKFTSLPSGSPFVLNVPTSDHQNLVLRIGKCSGRSTDKFSTLGILSCLPGWQDSIDVDVVPNKPNGMLSKKQIQGRERAQLASKTCALSCCVAHLVCTLVQCTDTHEVGFSDSNHLLLSAQISCAYVRPDYWDGKHFISQNANAPPILSFLGSGEFAHLVRQPPPPPSAPPVANDDEEEEAKDKSICV